MITIRKAVRLSEAEILDYLIKSVNWMQRKYPDVNFDNIHYIFGTGCRARYFRNEEQHNSHVIPTVFISCNRSEIIMYWKPSLGMVREEIYNVHKEDAMITQLVHELTHHVQYERGIRKGNETDTTANELEWLRENSPENYELFMVV